jgi:hypothetical protein
VAGLDGSSTEHKKIGCRKAVSNTSIKQVRTGHKLERPKKKVVGKPYEGELHVRFDVAGAEKPVRQNTAPDLDPTRWWHQPINKFIGWSHHREERALF